MDENKNKTLFLFGVVDSIEMSKTMPTVVDEIYQKAERVDIIFGKEDIFKNLIYERYLNNLNDNYINPASKENGTQNANIEEITKQISQIKINPFLDKTSLFKTLAFHSVVLANSKFDKVDEKEKFNIDNVEKTIIFNTTYSFNNENTIQGNFFSLFNLDSDKGFHQNTYLKAFFDSIYDSKKPQKVQYYLIGKFIKAKFGVYFGNKNEFEKAAVESFKAMLGLNLSDEYKQWVTATFQKIKVDKNWIIYTKQLKKTFEALSKKGISFGQKTITFVSKLQGQTVNSLYYYDTPNTIIQNPDTKIDEYVMLTKVVLNAAKEHLDTSVLKTYLQTDFNFERWIEACKYIENTFGSNLGLQKTKQIPPPLKMQKLDGSLEYANTSVSDLTKNLKKLNYVIGDVGRMQIGPITSKVIINSNGSFEGLRVYDSAKIAKENKKFKVDQGIYRVLLDVMKIEISTNVSETEAKLLIDFIEHHYFDYQDLDSIKLFLESFYKQTVLKVLS